MERKKLEYFVNIINQMLVLITAGIGSGIAFLQIQDLNINASKFIFYSVISLAASLPVGAFSYIVLANMADEEKPDFDKNTVRWPSLITVILFVTGVALFLIGAYKQYDYRLFVTDKKEAVKLLAPEIKKQDCLPRSISLEHLSEEQKVLLDAFIEKTFPRQKI